MASSAKCFFNCRGEAQSPGRRWYCAKLTMRWCFSSSDGRGAEALKAGDKGASEAGEPVAVRENRFALDGIQGLAHFSGRVRVVVQIADEGGDGALEVDIVLPESVVRIDEERLSGRELRHGFYGNESG